MIRCKWCNLKNEKYIEYHDKEWCKPNFDDKYLFEMLILESFQAGLSWECVLNKREDFRKAFDNFDVDKICSYNDEKIQELLKNKKIIRNKLKINAAINNSKIFKVPSYIKECAWGSEKIFIAFSNKLFKVINTYKNDTSLQLHPLKKEMWFTSTCSLDLPKIFLFLFRTCSFKKLTSFFSCLILF